MSKALLTVTGLSKRFDAYARAFNRVRAWYGAGPGPASATPVIDDVSFTLSAGEALAVIGSNGAGKSTLLKLIAGTLRPSSGTIDAGGATIAAILELGMGFDPEMTARANVWRGGATMGLTRRQIGARMEEIAAFADIGAAFDAPVRLLSSGMQMRVAFALATAVKPDILIVDEALSVGDAAFQHKCFERIRDYRRDGMALIFVSHDINAVLSVCDRAILLHAGRVAIDAEPARVVDHYNALIGTADGGEIDLAGDEEKPRVARSGSFEATVERADLIRDPKGGTGTGQRLRTAAVGADVALVLDIRVHAPIDRLVVGYAIRNRLGQTVFGTNTHYTGQAERALSPGERLRVVIRFTLALAPGDYAVTTSLSEGASHVGGNYEWRDAATHFSVVNTTLAPFNGFAHLPPVIAVERPAASQRLSA